MSRSASFVDFGGVGVGGDVDDDNDDDDDDMVRMIAFAFLVVEVVVTGTSILAWMLLLRAAAWARDGFMDLAWTRFEKKVASTFGR